MCDPLSIAIGGTVLGVAGAAKQAQEQNKYANRVANAQLQVSEAERQRQKGYVANSEAAATKAQGGFTREKQEQSLANAAATRSAQATSSISEQAPYEAGAGTPSIVNETMARAISDALSSGKDQTQKLAELSAYGDLNLGNKIALNRSGQEINEQQGFAKGSNALLPFELQAAQVGAKKPAAWPGLVSMLGQGLSLYGAGGGTFGFGGATPSVTTGSGAVTTGLGGLY